MQLNKNVAISDSGFIFNPATGDSFTTNAVGLDVLKSLQEETTRQAIISMLTGKYAVDSAQADKDLSDFVLMLESYQMLRSDE